MTKTHGPGSELELFAEASNWKSYFSTMLRPFIGRRVLEVGAGIGETTAWLCAASTERWICLEPDPVLALRIEEKTQAGQLPACCRLRRGTVDDLNGTERFDTVLYIDVLEHIEDDKEELRHAARHLDDGGRLIVLAPAHQNLYSLFDHEIGHFRRYDKASLLAVPEPYFELLALRYLDSVGWLASLANRLVLKQRLPTHRQIRFWDRKLVPASRRLDPALQFRFGKSILGVWQKTPAR